MATQSDLVFFYDGMVTASSDDFQRRLLEEVGGDELEGHFVQVDPTVGLDAATVDRAVEILQVAEAPADSRRQPRSWWRRCRHGLSWLVVRGAHQQGDGAPR